MKKLYWLITILLTSFLGYLIIFFLPRDYEINYQLEAYKIDEKYIKSLKYYQYLINYQDKIYPLIISSKYSTKRQNVEKIEEFNNEETSCLLVTIKDEHYPICYDKEQLISFHLVDEEIKVNFPTLKEYNDTVTDNYENIKIYNLLDKDYFIWNYKGYIYLSNNQKESINIIKNDDYNNALAYQFANYIITPNYDNKFFFKEYFIIDTDKIELSTFKFDDKYEISYNSYYLGDYHKYLYLVDRKNKIEYKFNINKKTIEIIGDENNDGIWYNNGWEDVSLNKLINNDYQFQQKKVYNFQLIDGQLYSLIEDYKTLISQNKITDIIAIKNDEIYYLVKNTLYMYSDKYGEIKLLEHNEWDFNHQNKIFIIE